MRKFLASVLLAGLSLHLAGCSGGSNSGGSGGNGNGGGGTPPPVALSSITVSTAASSVAPGTTTQFTAQGKFSDGTTQNLTSKVAWSSSQTSVATMNANGVAGLANAIAAGTSTITASMSGVSGTATLTVTNASLVSMNVTPANPSINVGTQQQFTATGAFSDGTNQDISNVVAWSSSPSGVASITTRSGLATGNSTGTATVTATFTAGSLSIQGNTQLTVTLANLISLAITPANPKIAMNTSQLFSAIGTFEDGSTHNLSSLVTWSSSNTSVATIAPHNNSAFGVAPGTATISATTGSVSASTVLTVTNATLVSIAIAPSGLSIPAGVIVNLTATGTFSDSSTQLLTIPCNWASQNPSIATVNNSGSSSGITTAVSPGLATITATAPPVLGGIIFGQTQLTVNSATLKSIALSGNSLIAPGSSVQFQASGSYSDGSTHSLTKAVTWASSNHAVATISSGGTVTAQGAGTSNITATQNGISGSQGLLVTSSQLTSITITSTNASSKLAQQTSVQLTATGHFADGSTQSLTNVATWTSSNPAVATVGHNSGVVSGVAPGLVNVTAVFNGIGGSLNNLQVTNANLVGLTITPKTPTISLGFSMQFTATGTFDDGTTQVLTNFSNWTTSNASVAVVNKFGLATSSGTGTTTITVSATQNLTTQTDAATLTVQ
jgi:uncharacterized protein YjdB